MNVHVCFNCPDRHPNCHSKCDRYKVTQEKYAEIREERRKERAPYEFLGDGYRKAVKYAHRKRRN